MLLSFSPLHPAIVHFPITLFLLAGLFGLISLFVKREFWKGLTIKSLIGGIIFSPFAVISGMIEEQNIQHHEAVHEIMQLHKYCGFAILFFFQILIVWYWLRRILMGNKEYMLWIIFLLLGSALVLFQGYLGGEMVFDKGAGVKPMELMMESQEKQGSGHEHDGKKESKGSEGKEDMNHENMKEMQGMNSEKSKEKDGEKKQTNEHKSMKGEHDMKNMNNAKEEKGNHQMDNMNNSGNDMKDHGSMKKMDDTKDTKAEHNMSNMDEHSQMKEMKNQNMSGMNMNNPMDTFKFKDNNPAWQKVQKEKNKIKK